MSSLSARKFRSACRIWMCRRGGTIWRRTSPDRELVASMDKVAPEDDAKLQHLKGVIGAKLSRPLNPGNRKIVIFTAFADTANYLYANISTAFLQSHRHPLRQGDRLGARRRPRSRKAMTSSLF